MQVVAIVEKFLCCVIIFSLVYTIVFNKCNLIQCIVLGNRLALQLYVAVDMIFVDL